jgi:hypothetical protein
METTEKELRTCECGQVLWPDDDTTLCGACLIDEWSGYDEELGEPCDFCHVCHDATDCAPIRYVYVLSERTGTVVQGQACTACREFINQQKDIEITK